MLDWSIWSLPLLLNIYGCLCCNFRISSCGMIKPVWMYVLDITPKRLPKFPNGQQFFFKKRRSIANVIAHANHMTGLEKVMRMIASNMWCDYNSGYSICTHSSCKKKCSSFKPPPWCKDFWNVCKTRFHSSFLCIYYVYQTSQRT